MSSKEQKTPEEPRDDKIANLEAQLAEAQKREREVMLRAKAA